MEAGPGKVVGQRLFQGKESGKEGISKLEQRLARQGPLYSKKKSLEANVLE